MHIVYYIGLFSRQAGGANHAAERHCIDNLAIIALATVQLTSVVQTNNAQGANLGVNGKGVDRERVALSVRCNFEHHLQIIVFVVHST